MHDISAQLAFYYKNDMGYSPSVLLLFLDISILYDFQFKFWNNNDPARTASDR